MHLNNGTIHFLTVGWVGGGGTAEEQIFSKAACLWKNHTQNRTKMSTNHWILIQNAGEGKTDFLSFWPLITFTFCSSLPPLIIFFFYLGGDGQKHIENLVYKEKKVPFFNFASGKNDMAAKDLVNLKLQRHLVAK